MTVITKLQDEVGCLEGWGHTVLELKVVWKMHSTHHAESRTLLKCTNK